MNASERAKKYRATLRGYAICLFHHLNERCNKPYHSKWKHYGGRGIKLMFKSSSEFADYVMYELKVDPRGLDCDRIDNDGHYERGNIQFITHAENVRKKVKV